MLGQSFNVDIVGLMIMIISAFIGYGSRYIVERILKLSSDRAEQYNIVLKFIAVFMAMIGMLKVFNKI